MGGNRPETSHVNSCVIYFVSHLCVTSSSTCSLRACALDARCSQLLEVVSSQQSQITAPLRSLTPHQPDDRNRCWTHLRLWRPHALAKITTHINFCEELIQNDVTTVFFHHSPVTSFSFRFTTASLNRKKVLRWESRY